MEAVRQNELRVFEQRLQQELQAEALPLLQIRCSLKRGTLIVLAQSHVLPDSQQVFSVLKRVIQRLQPDLLQIPGMLETLPVQLYLRIAGRQPHASHTFTIALAPQAPTSQALTTPVEMAEEGSEAAKDDSITEPNSSNLAVISEGAIVPLTDRFAADLDSLAVEPILSRFPLPVLVLGATIALLSFAGSLYAMTRPCVIGACVPLQTAQQLHQESVQTLQTHVSAQSVVEAYEQLVEASYLLNTIPSWSSHYEAAQAQLGIYEAEAEILQKVVVAQQQAYAAAVRSQNPPHPLSEWEEIRVLWREAIISLEEVPANNPIYLLAQRKLTEYRENLGAINQRVLKEQQAQAKVAFARETARLAEARQGIADSVESWQLAHSTWQVVVNQLEQIPQGTMAHAEAQQLLAIYEPRLANVRDRRTQEEISATAYNQALSLADQAHDLEEQNQWSGAIAFWRDALTHAQQVPTGTIHHSQAQPLISSYNAALTEAQESLRLAVAMQAVRADLDRTCASTPRICSYTLAGDVIQVRVTPDYDQAVERAMVTTRLTGDYSTQVEVVAHTNTLLRAIAAISENSQVPIEVYNADGSLFGTYVPDLSGYVPAR